MGEKLEEVKVHRERVEENSPLYAIREKEIEINTRLLKAKEQANKVVQQAWKEAEKIKEKARKEGEKKAQKEYQKIIEKSAVEAEKIKKSLDKEVEAIKKQASSNRKKAAEFLIQSVLPEI